MWGVLSAHMFLDMLRKLGEERLQCRRLKSAKAVWLLI